MEQEAAKRAGGGKGGESDEEGGGPVLAKPVAAPAPQVGLEQVVCL